MSISAPPPPVLPLPISHIGLHYLIFSPSAAHYVRTQHHILGVTIGTLPQIPQQNIFLGLPLQLMAEEARLLVDLGIAYISDDAQVLRNAFATLNVEECNQLRKEEEEEGMEIARAEKQKKEKRKEEVLKALQKRQASSSRQEEKQKLKLKQPEGSSSYVSLTSESKSSVQEESESIFETAPSSPAHTPTPTPTPTPTNQPDLQPYGVTRHTMSNLSGLLPSVVSSLPTVPSSYAFFVYLHAHAYYISPGLRFGCQYMVYPGDPLRYHSHFLARGLDWNEEFCLMDVVGGGRLGTGVKKGYLFGGEQPNDDSTKTNVRTFSVEWAGM